MIRIHGRATALASNHPDSSAIEQLQHANGPSPRNCAVGLYLYLADVIDTFARYLE